MALMRKLTGLSPTENEMIYYKVSKSLRFRIPIGFYARVPLSENKTPKYCPFKLFSISDNKRN